MSIISYFLYSLCCPPIIIFIIAIFSPMVQQFKDIFYFCIISADTKIEPAYLAYRLQDCLKSVCTKERIPICFSSSSIIRKNSQRYEKIS